MWFAGRGKSSTYDELETEGRLAHGPQLHFNAHGYTRLHDGFLTILGKGSTRSNSLKLAAAQSLFFKAHLSENARIALGFAIKERESWFTVTDILDNLRLDWIHRSDDSASTFSLQRRRLTLTHALQLAKRDDTFGLSARFGYSADPAGQGELRPQKFGLRYRVGGTTTYDQGSPIFLLSASTKYLAEKTRPLDVSLTTSTLVDTAWHTSAAVKMRFVNFGGYRLNQAALPIVGGGVAVEPTIELGTWRHLRDPNISFIPRLNASINPFRKSAVFRVGALLPLQEWPSPLFQVEYDTARKDLTLSAGIKIN